MSEKKQPGQDLPPNVKGMILKMIQGIWGNLRTKPAQQAWAKAQKARVAADLETENALLRQWLIDNNVAEDVVRRAWEQGGTKFQALRYIRDQKDWIEYYDLTDQINAAFKKYAPK